MNLQDQKITQIRISDKTTIDPNQTIGEVALFNSDGSPFTGGSSLEPILVSGDIMSSNKTTTSSLPPLNSLVALKFVDGNASGYVFISFDGSPEIPVVIGGYMPEGGQCSTGTNGIAICFFDGESLHLTGSISNPTPG